MGINISQIKNQNLKELASLVDNSFNGKTRGNGMIDDCELSVFIDKAKKFGMESECSEILGLSKTTRKNNSQNVKAGQVAVKNDTTPVKQKAVIKTKPSLSELETKINKKKEEIEQISYKLEFPKASCAQKGALIGITGAGVAATVGLLAAGLVGGEIILGVAAATAFIGGGAVVGGVAGKIVGLISNESETREKEQAELRKSLNKAEKELQILEKQYSEYQ